VLFAGNSLLLEGVDFVDLKQRLAPNLEIHRTVFENTSYFDWFYGLHKLFKLGSQPDVVVLVLTVNQLVSNATNGDYSAKMLVDRHDLLRFANDVGADSNRLSILALDNISFFYGTRAEIRTWILGKLLPDFPTLTRELRPASNVQEQRYTTELLKTRLGNLRDLCNQNGAELVLVIPPTLNAPPTSTINDVAAQEDVRLIVPIRAEALAASDYSDGLHLNSVGALKFTPALAASLEQVNYRVGK
jgi:hypothetical protein